MPSTHDQDKYNSDPPKNFRFLIAFIIFISILLVAMLIRYHAIIFSPVQFPA